MSLAFRILASRACTFTKAVRSAKTKSSRARSKLDLLKTDELRSASVRSASRKSARINADSTSLATPRHALLNMARLDVQRTRNAPLIFASSKSAPLRSQNSSVARSRLAPLTLARTIVASVRLAPSRDALTSVASVRSLPVKSASVQLLRLRLVCRNLMNFKDAPRRLIPARSLPDKSTGPPWATSFAISSAVIVAIFPPYSSLGGAPSISSDPPWRQEFSSADWCVKYCSTVNLPPSQSTRNTPSRTMAPVVDLRSPPDCPGPSRRTPARGRDRGWSRLCAHSQLRGWTGRP